MSSSAPASPQPRVRVRPWPWQAHELLTAACTYSHSILEMVFSNGWENLSSALGLGGAGHPTARLDGKVCIVTGANAGIGLSTSEALARMGAHVILACRSPSRGRAAQEGIVKAVGGAGSNGSSSKVEVMELDLGSLDSVRRFIKSFNARHLPLHLLVCNAGIMAPPERLTSADGMEMQFQVNFLSHWLLAHDLVAEQRRKRRQSGSSSSSSSSGGRGSTEASPSPSCSSGEGFGLRPDGTRVVLLSSCTHSSGGLIWSDMQAQHHYSPFLSYAFSKLALVLNAKELQRRFNRNPGYGADSAVAVHPGVVDTGLANEFFMNEARFLARPLLGARHPSPLEWLRSSLRALMRPTLRTPEAATCTALYAALAPAGKVAGQYIVPQASVGTPDKAALDEARALQLWDYAVQLTCPGLKTDASLA